ncbi:hypothetical protein OJF2_45490 [Aquisphaera giovannonii]|uniref:Putative Flp pilus-assembly TadG-like N-terminal domain-containing protein n=1 Tax=Aquisphaera giovannonii TaxID=406548 RepID=A0A5B9W7J7_9BACT|nr:Tad domain-containing protein [Aquisphaera giovannonii]QEH35991.1 hypothetical protein OJF2_45490 [Aquisphaera giovannonii]
MRIRTKPRGRRGTIIPFVAIGLVAMMSFCALAIDVGMLAVARTEAQAVADSAALVGARTLNGSAASNNNYSAAGPAAVATAANGTILGKSVQASQVQTTIGKYYYDTIKSKFVAYPIDAGSVNDAGTNWSLASCTVSAAGNTAFSAIMGAGRLSIKATGTAVHRPRDVAIVIDLSGSMRFSSLLGIPYSGDRSTNNPDPAYPKFGHYSSSSAGMYQGQSVSTVSGYTYYASNTTASNSLSMNRPAIVADFFDGPNSSNPAFTPAGAGDSEGFVSGDRPLRKQGNGSGQAYATNFQDVNNGSTSKSTTLAAAFESTGYDSAALGTGGFKGYTQGPGYWGKTFFLWPPDPRGATTTTTASQHNNGAMDWRQRFFLKSDGVTPVNDNTLLWASDGDWLSPGSSSTYKINYRAILQWIKNTGPNPFPAKLQAGRILYYNKIPDPADTGLNTRMWGQYPVTDPDERFWKEFIDYVLGVCQKGSSSWLTSSASGSNIVSYTGYGDDYNWGTVRISAKPSGQSMDYRDNPSRPRAHFWFGPMMLVDFLGSYNMTNNFSDGRFAWMPGTAHEAPSYACKLGILGALSDIQNNHPNDQVSLIFYSTPRESSNDAGARFNNVRVPLGRDYSRMKDALFFPPSTLADGGASGLPRMFDAGSIEVPRPGGGTCFAMGLMLAFNQFSSEPTLRTFNPYPAPTGDAGGLGRSGAYKMVILETDGIPNTSATASLVSQSSGGANCSYYRIRYNSTNPSSSEYPSVANSGDNSSQVTSQIYDIAAKLCAKDTDPTPGFATSRKPVQIHCIGFGPVFETTSTNRAAALTTLQQIERIGNTQSSTTPNAWLPDYKIVTGSDDAVVQKLRTAVINIMQSGVQVSLIN